jgi:osmotically-inducible protein OsmY
MRKTDQELKSTVTEELQYLPNLDATGVAVLVDNGMVTLSGEVASLPERHAATHAAMRIEGVKRVADKMVVRTPAAFGGSDQDIARAASQFLEWTVDVPANAVKADVRDHEVTLSGKVDWEYQRDAATRAVMYIKGVTMIDNKISLDQRPPSSATKATVEAAMQRNVQLDPQKITVDISGPELTLRGSVRSLVERRQAEHAAWGATGVTSVKNELLVTS